MACRSRVDAVTELMRTKRRSNLTDKQRFRLREVSRYDLKTARACLQKEEFQQFRD
jgi:transposase